MNKAVLSLAASTLVLAAASVYLTRQIALERVLQGSIAAASSTGAVPASATEGNAVRAADGAMPTTEIQDTATSSGDATDDAAAATFKQFSPDTYQKLMDAETEASKRDPQLRRELIEERIPIIRDQYLPLQRRLKVDNERWQRFMEVLAAHDLGYFAALADCKKARNCDQPDISADQYAQQRQEIVDVLGDAHATAFESFRNSGTERGGVSQMQTELPEDLQIPEDRAEDLVQALAKTRMAVEAEMSAREKTPGRFYQGFGALLYDKDLPTPEARVEDARKYSDRLRTEAAKFLQGPQLAAFKRQQDRLLELLRVSQVKPPAGG